MTTRRKAPDRCHCGSGKLPGIMRTHGWCCGECYNDRTQCPGPERSPLWSPMDRAIYGDPAPGDDR